MPSSGLQGATPRAPWGASASAAHTNQPWLEQLLEIPDSFLNSFLLDGGSAVHTHTQHQPPPDDAHDEYGKWSADQWCIDPVSLSVAGRPRTSTLQLHSISFPNKSSDGPRFDVEIR